MRAGRGRSPTNEHDHAIAMSISHHHLQLLQLSCDTPVSQLPFCALSCCLLDIQKIVLLIDKQRLIS